MAILKIKDKGVWKEIQAIKGDTGHDVYVGDKSKAPSEAKLIIEPVKGTATGTDIQVTDSANDRVSKLVLDGKSTQETTTGKNLLDTKTLLVQSRTVNGLNYLNNGNGTFNISGTTTKTTSLELIQISKDFFDFSKTYYFYCSQNYNASKFNLCFQIRKNDGGTTFFIANKSLDFSTIDKSKVKTIGLIFYASANTTINSGNNVKLMIVEGDTPPSYEPYTGGQPSPNPDYPSEIENVKGKNLINIDDKNYVDPLISVDKDGWITATYDNTNDTSTKFMNYFTNNLNLKTSSKYNAIVEVKSVSGSGELTLYSNLQNYGQPTSSKSFSFNVLSNNSIYNSVFTTRSSFVNITQGIRTYVKFSAGESGSITFRLSVLEDISNFKYVPYGNIQIAETGKNLFDKNTITENKILDPNGNENFDENCDLSDYIKIQPNTTYTRNITASAYECICFYTSEKVFISRDTTHSTTTSPNNAYYVRISCYKTNLDTLQLEKGPIATDYEPYTEEVVNIDLKGNELCSLPNGTKDELIVKNGRAKIIKRIGKVVLDGSESSWLENSVTKGLFQITLTNIPIDLTITRAMSNYFKGINGSAIAPSDNSVCTYRGNRIMFTYKTYANNINGLKTWLSTHNTTVQYELETPEEIDLGEVSMLTTYEGTSNITNSEDAEMSIEYVTNKTNLYYQNNGNIIKMNEGS